MRLYSTAASAPKLRRVSARNSSTNSTLRCCAWAAGLHRFPSLRSSSMRCFRGVRISCAQRARSWAEPGKSGRSVGDGVTAGEPLLEVETEKSVVEIEAAATGRLTQILVEVDSRAVVGDQVAWIESAAVQGSGPATVTPRPADPEIVAASSMVQSSSIVQATPSTAAMAARDGGRHAARIRSTPVARKLAADRGVDLGGIVGTGPGGHVQLDDVRRAIEAPRLQAPRLAKPSAQPLPPMRRALARAMTTSHATIPQFMVARSVD